MRAIGLDLTHWLGWSNVRMSAAVNVVCYVLLVFASLASFRLMIMLTDTASVGLWGLINGLAMVVLIAEMGLSANLTRFVAARTDVSRRLLAQLLGATVIMCLLPATVIAVASAWPMFELSVSRPGLTVDAPDVAKLTFLGLAGMMILSISTALSGLAEGVGRLRQRSASGLLYNLVTLATLWPAVDRFGVVGIGIANLLGLCVQLLIILGSLAFAALKLPGEGEAPGVAVLIRELFASTVLNLGTTILNKTLDPVARLFVGLGGSLTVQAWYELAARVCNQVRSMAIMGLQPMLFAGAADREALATRFDRPQGLAARLAALMYLGLACGAPFISLVLFAEVQPLFVVFALILGLGGALHVAGYLGYFAIVAHGQFGALLRITAAAAAINVLIGATVALGAGPFAGATGLSVGYGYAGYAYLKRYSRIAQRPILSLLDGFWFLSVLATLVGVALTLATYYYSQPVVLALAAASCLLLIKPSWSLGWSLLGPVRQRGTWRT
jgi:O-antigen/teichoic acid export membrane protein